MDAESFAQCLHYIQANHSEFSFDKLIPVGSAFVGAILGFALNYLSSARKDNSSTTNKVTCCREDIENIRQRATIVLSELCNACITIASNKCVRVHQTPDNVSGLCLDEYFIEIAHKFTRSQRQTIQLLIMSLKRLNRRLPELNEGDLVSICEYATIVINLANITLNVIGHCKNFDCGELIDHQDEEVYEWAQLTDEQIGALTSLQTNARFGNQILRLDTNITER
ncbi:hypothetical protein HU720_02120 [Pseudomonas sp. SWRI51]|uniref:hypothetical protein n=1 Tax=Pseudomonas sp. SWRI51 TaxID=2745491 RepID=UPI001646FAE7|nr:hypothetical protein [Pseudomonas sp. SWRI51]MBC3410100.1 hypothetical protein [Pseudomonas sp. SWRI51]